MANWIYVLCRDERLVTRGVLEDFMGHWGWLDEPATFTPALDREETSNPAWGYFELEYRPRKRPVQVHNWRTPDALQPTLDDILDAHAHSLSAYPDDQAPDRCSTGVRFRVGVGTAPGRLGMLDVTEAFLARERDGIVVADEGIYDADLRLLLKLRD
jgi:hypothetical protein